MCNIIINTFCISDKILSSYKMYDIIQKIQLTTYRWGIHVKPFLKIVNIVHFEVSLKKSHFIIWRK